MTAPSFDRRSMLKAVGLTSGALLAGPALAGCGGKPAGGSTDFAFMSWDTTSGTPLYDVAQDWAKSASKKIDIQSVPGDDYDTKLRTVLSSGSAPTAIRINDDYVRGYSQSGTLLDLRKYLERDKINADDYYPVAYNFAKQPDGSRTAWPIMTNPGVFYINKDAFAEAGVPLPPTDWSDDKWKWADFLDAAKKLTKPGGQRWGCLIFPDTSLETVWPVNNGTTGIYSADGKRFTLADKGSTDALQWIADLALVHKVHPDFATVDAGQSTPNWALSQFATGKVAMLISLTSGIPYVAENAKFDWDIVAPPGQAQHKTVNTMTVLAIPKDSNDPDTAWEFLKYFVGEQASNTLAATHGFLPVAKSAAKHFRSTAGSPANAPLVPIAVDHAVNENYSPYVEQARTIYRPVLDDVWSGRQTAAKALAAVRGKVDAVLTGGGRQ